MVLLKVRVRPVLQQHLNQSHVLSLHSILYKLSLKVTYMEGSLTVDVGVVDISLLLLDEGNYFMDISVVDGMQK